MTKKPPGLILCLDCMTDYSISVDNDRGRKLTVDEARAAWESGRVADYNLAFFRLVQNDWDMDAVKDYFADLVAKRL